MNAKEVITKLNSLIHQMKILNLDSEDYQSIATLYIQATEYLAKYSKSAAKLVADTHFSSDAEKNKATRAATNLSTFISDDGYDKWNVDTDDEAGSTVLHYIEAHGFSEVADEGGEPFEALVQLGKYDAGAFVMNHYGNVYSSHWTALTPEALTTIIKDGIKAVQKFRTNWKPVRV